MSLVDLSPVSPEVLARLVKRSGQTRVGLQAVLGVSGPTVTRAATELARLGVVEASHVAAAGRGRPAETMQLSSGGLCSIGISIRADRSSVRLLDSRGEAFEGMALDISQETPYATAVGLIGEAVLKLAGVAAERFAALGSVGISFFGSADYEQGKITEPSTFKAWHHRTLARDLEVYTGLPTAIENYSIALVSAVNWFDADEPTDFFLVVADYGIGGVSSVAGQPFLGPERRPAGFGHIEGQSSGSRLCHCGAYDCQMTTASVRAIRAQAEEMGLVATGRADLGPLVEDLDRMDDPRASDMLFAAGARLAGNALAICRGMGLPVCFLGGALFDRSAAARRAASEAFSTPGHTVKARFLVDVFAGRETDDLAAAAVAYHHLSQTRKLYLLERQQELGTLLVQRNL
jgi:predicted NBD/HSP70 family sugar kinase